MHNTFQVLNSPVVTVAIGVVLTAFVSAAAAVIGLFVKVSAMSAKIASIAKDVNDLTTDKDVMRWSQWGPMEHQPNSAATHETRRQ